MQVKFILVPIRTWLFKKESLKKNIFLDSSEFSSKIVGLVATSLIFLYSKTTFIVVASTSVVHYCLMWDLNFFLKSDFFSAQLVSAQRLSSLFFFRNFRSVVVVVLKFKGLTCLPGKNFYRDIWMFIWLNFCKTFYICFLYMFFNISLVSEVERSSAWPLCKICNSSEKFWDKIWIFNEPNYA